MFAKHRLEAHSDGIFAVVMTLLVIDIRIPADITSGQLTEALRHEVPALLAFAITFGIAARYWTLQSRIFALADKVHKDAVPATMLFLGFVTLLPFTTALASRYGAERLIFGLYCLNQSLIGAALIFKLEIIRHHSLTNFSAEVRYLRTRVWSLTLAMALAGACSFLMPMRFVFFVPVVSMVAVRRVFRDPAATRGGLSSAS